MSNKTGMVRLFELTGEKRGLILVSGLLSAISAILIMMPYASVYFILKELLVLKDFYSTLPMKKIM
ncbi:hypothetical protein [Paenibacillus lautus]|uniref:hypothetical protein n=1 Tax=Paenibacillus lautus TaxID=1401 RepID=UPI001C0FD24D|nr:hypothetical protein [Paenibacillus lautus]MBU5350097.1 hypothetical protein [Paenibacillus lautus]